MTVPKAQIGENIYDRTTVGAAVKLGLKPILVLSGGDTGSLSGNLNLDAMMGADIYFVKDPAKTADVAADYLLGHPIKVED